MTSDSLTQKIFENLNNKQEEAVSSVSGSTLVIAGAGSGKTAVLTRRCAYLIAKGSKPGSVLSLTFTNKAANEMRHRVKKILAEVGINIPDVPPWVEDYENAPLLSTFHSLGVKILREFGDRLDLKKEFSIIDSDDQKKIVRRILKELNISEKIVAPRLVTYFISQCKQELLTAGESRRLSKEFLPVFHQIYRKYEDELKSNQVVDFDDLLLLTYTLLRDNEDVLEILRDRWRHIQIDEFQDTNQAQFEIVKLLCPDSFLSGLDERRSLFVVGDDAQSIYAFRGSKIEIILNFENEYSGTKEIILNQNYRSTQPILDLAEKVLTHNSRQKKKDLFTDKNEKKDIFYYIARNEKDEADFIVKKLYSLYVNTNSQNPHNPANSDSLEETPKIKDFDPLEGVRGTGEQAVQNSLSEITFEPDEAEAPSTEKDPISSMFDVYLETDEFQPSSINTYSPNEWQLPKANWNQVESLNNVAILYRTHGQSRAIEEIFLKNNVPYRLVSGVKFLDRKEIKDVLAILRFLANGDDKFSLSRFLPLVMTGVGPKTMEKIFAYLEDPEYPLAPKFSSALLEVLGKMQQVWINNDNLIDLTKEILAVSGYLRYLKEEYPTKEEFEARVENIGEIYSLMYPFDEDKSISLPERLNNFLAHVMLMSTQDVSDDNTPKVNLMSLHQSKGLEFETVFLVGLEDGILPHQNSLVEPDGLEEEVRLAYVGVTRAKANLFLLSADSRVQFGQIKANPGSRIFRPFLDKFCRRERG